MRAFTYEGLPSRVVFGRGTLAKVEEELDRLGHDKALVLSTPQQQGAAEALAERLGAKAAGVFAGAAMHTPVEVSKRAVAALEACGAACTVALGGGSTTGLGKAVALRAGSDQVVIPTTYAGSEMTPILGQTEGGAKTTLKDRAVLPEVVIYDVDLTLTLPPKLSAVSGLNAMAHAVEALYAQDRNPIVGLMATEAIRALRAALPAIVDDPGDVEARSGALYGAWLCGAALGSVGMALHHKLCHALGGAFDLPHAETHAVILPHATAYNAEAAAEELRSLGGAPGAALYDLAGRIGAPLSLKDIGMPEAGLDRAAELAAKNPYWNPRPIDRGGIRALLDDAWHGRRPTG